MQATVAFYNEILLYHSIFLHGFSLRNRGEIRKSYYKINKTTVQKRKLICPRLYRALDRSKPLTFSWSWPTLAAWEKGQNTEPSGLKREALL